MIAIVANGGAGGIGFAHRRKKGLIRAVEAGYKILRQGGSAFDAVVEATVILEDTPIFNAGIGSAPNIYGEVEMDASVMTSDMQCGAVAIIKDVKNPILVARAVMEKTDHIILGGKGACDFARRLGYPKFNCLTREKKRLLKLELARVKRGRKNRYFPKLKPLLKMYDLDTVGAVAIDGKGRIAVTNSTGGINAKLPGRIGDTPVFGAGLFANRYGGVATTGHGETIIRLCLAKVCADLMQRNPAQHAVDLALEFARRNKSQCGAIAIDRKGRIGVGTNTAGMSWAAIKNGHLAAFKY